MRPTDDVPRFPAPSRSSDADLDAPPDLGEELTRGFTARLIRRKVRQLLRRPEFNAADASDLEQELRMFVCERAHAFNPGVAHWNVYATTIVERGVADLVEYANAAKRALGENPLSLSLLVSSHEVTATELGETLEEADGGRRGALAAEGSAVAFARTADVHTAIARLPPDLRDLCARLQTRSVAQAARELGIPRSTMRDRLKRLRSTFEATISENL